MRLLRLCTNYPAYLRQFYAARAGLSDETYRVQYRALAGDCYGWADNWTRALRPFGYEAWEPVGNAEPMQKAWARENGAGFRPDGWLEDIAVAQARRFRPDVVLVNDHSTYTAAFFRRLRAECPSIRRVVGWCGAPYRDASVFREYDLVLTNIPGFVTRFRELGHRCLRMRHGFEPAVLEKAGACGPATPFSFVGSIVRREGFHNAREALLAKLAREAGLEIFADVARPTPDELRVLDRMRRRYDAVKAAASIPGMRAVLAAIPRVGAYVAMEGRPALAQYVDPAIRERARPSVFGLAMYRTLAASRVTLNTHIDASLAWASNMRLFEATGVGTCLLTERQPDLGEIFEPDAEVATYGSAEEAVEKARYLLEHDDARAAIGAAGQKRTLRDHTFDARARELDAAIRGIL